MRALALTVALAACGRAAPEGRPTDEPTTSSSPTEPTKGPSVTDTASIQSAVAKLQGQSPDTVEVELDDEAVAPGLVFFKFELDGGGDAGAYGSGVVAGGEVLVGFGKAGPKVAAALVDSIDAVALARAFGVLETEGDTARALVEDDQISDMPEDWKKHVHLPKLESAGDGRVLTYWCESGEPPLFRSTITIKKSGEVTRQRKDIWSFVGR